MAFPPQFKGAAKGKGASKGKGALKGLKAAHGKNAAPAQSAPKAPPAAGAPDIPIPGKPKLPLGRPLAINPLKGLIDAVKAKQVPAIAQQIAPTTGLQ